jgi:hypothetical protein
MEPGLMRAQATGMGELISFLNVADNIDRSTRKRGNLAQWIAMPRTIGFGFLNGYLEIRLIHQ